MKYIFYLFSYLILFSCSPRIDAVRKIPAANRHAPPGTIWLKDSLYMDQTEVRNLDYLEYIHWLKKYDPALVSDALPDTMVWRAEHHFGVVMLNYYFTFPAYRDFPVVGVTRQQAEAFCRWRSDRVNEFMTLMKKPPFSSVSYRLPSAGEWEYAAFAGGHSMYGYSSLIDNHYLPKIAVEETTLLGYTSGMPMPVYFGSANSFGLYNMIGNVAELTATDSVVKGGSFIHSLSISAVTDSLQCESARFWLGFRCVCIVHR